MHIKDWNDAAVLYSEPKYISSKAYLLSALSIESLSFQLFDTLKVSRAICLKSLLPSNGVF